MAPLPLSCINSAFQLVMPVAKTSFHHKASTKACLELSRHIDKYNVQVLWKENDVKSNFKKIHPSQGSRFEPLPLERKSSWKWLIIKAQVINRILYCKRRIIFMSAAKCSAQKTWLGESVIAQAPSRAHCSSGLAHLRHKRAHAGGTYPEARGMDLFLQVVHEQREMESQHQEACLTTTE